MEEKKYKCCICEEILVHKDIHWFLNNVYVCMGCVISNDSVWLHKQVDKLHGWDKEDNKC